MRRTLASAVRHAPDAYGSPYSPAMTRRAGESPLDYARRVLMAGILTERAARMRADVIIDAEDAALHAALKRHARRRRLRQAWGVVIDGARSLARP